MTQYQTKPAAVDAFQFDGQPATVQAIQAATGTGFAVSFFQAGTAGSSPVANINNLKTHTNQQAMVGNWIVVNANKSAVTVLDDAAFQDGYSAVEAQAASTASTSSQASAATDAGSASASAPQA